MGQKKPTPKIPGKTPRGGFYWPTLNTGVKNNHRGPKKTVKKPPSSGGGFFTARLSWGGGFYGTPFIGWALFHVGSTSRRLSSSEPPNDDQVGPQYTSIPPPLSSVQFHATLDVSDKAVFKSSLVVKVGIRPGNELHYARLCFWMLVTAPVSSMTITTGGESY